MLKTTLTTVSVVVTPALLLAGAIWLIRSGRSVSRTRRKLFLSGLLATTIAYAGHFLLRWFLHRANLNIYDQADLTLGVGGLMFLAAFVGLIASLFGTSYGRICSACASILTGALWWLTSITRL